MSAQIPSLIAAADNVEVVRDTLVQILAFEVASQKALALDEGEDPRIWDLRIFKERSSPWEVFQGMEPAGTIDLTPFVNVTFDQDAPEKRRSVVTHQVTTATFNLDVYGAGVAEETLEGHMPADEAAALARDRAKRLVRNIIMAEAYSYLGDPPSKIDRETGDVLHERAISERWIRSTTAFDPPADANQLVKVAAARIALEVTFREDVPVRPGTELDGIHLSIRRAGDGSLFFDAEFTPNPPD